MSNALHFLVVLLVLFFTVQTGTAKSFNSMSSDNNLENRSDFKPTTNIIVNTQDDVIDGDDGKCSLREAVIAANYDLASGGVAGECIKGDGADTIFLPAGVYKLTIAGADENLAASGDLDIYGSLNIINARLGPLGNWGGPTQTHPLLYDSPAIDSGANTDCPAVDQRGETRPIDGNGVGGATCDIGAFESESSYSVIYLPMVIR